MKKLGVLVVLLGLMVLTVSACGTDTSTPTRAAATTYSINHDTGLYASLSATADQLAVLSSGTRVAPADGGTSLNCSSVTDSGITMTLCEIKVVSTEETGWVLKQWISTN